MTEAPAGRSAADALAESDDLVSAGNVRAAIDLLERAASGGTEPELLERALEIRHQGFRRPDHPPPLPWPRSAADRFERSGVPEVPAAQLDPETLAAGLAHRGCLLVRGLLTREVTDALLVDLKRAFDAADEFAAGEPASRTSPWYRPFEAGEGYSFGSLERGFARGLGGLLTVESPAALSNLIRAYRDVGLGDLLAAHFGEWPAVSAKKSTLRRARPTAPTEWHQDGAFLGVDTRSVNVWLALSSCGIDAASIDVFPRPYDHIVETGGEDALFSWSVSPTQAVEAAGVPVERPCFEPGDALLFDQLTLHRTGVEPGMTEDRYAIESWFFAPSTYPHAQVPILF